MKRILIFGATSAIATACARRWVGAGAHVFLVGRNSELLQAIISDLRVRRGSESQCVEGTHADLNALDKHEGIIQQAEIALGGIDVVLIAHGTLPDQVACQESVELSLREIQTNAISVIALATVIANRFDRAGTGALAVISSVAGDRGRQSNYIYGAAKGMVSIYLQGLRNRLARKQISVTTIKPGFVDTPMTVGFKSKGLLWVKPDVVAEGIVRAIDRGADEVYLPGFWRLIMLVIRHIPEFVFKRMSL